MTSLPLSEARSHLGDLCNRVAYSGERVVLSRNGRPVAALVSAEDLALLAHMEDKADVAAGRKALRETGSISLKDLKKEMGL